MFTSIPAVKAANRSIGHHFFDKETMAWFNSKIESPLIAGEFFVTSESQEYDSERFFTIRRVRKDGSIDTIGEFMQYKTLKEAKAAI